MSYNLNKKVVIITGGTSGIGLETARLFSKESAKIMITGRDIPKMEKAKRMLEEEGADIDSISADLSNLEDMDKIIEKTEKNLGPVDILINNAGKSYPGDFFSTEPKLWEEILKNRITSPLYLTQKVLSKMTK